MMRDDLRRCSGDDDDGIAVTKAFSLKMTRERRKNFFRQNDFDFRRVLLLPSKEETKGDSGEKSSGVNWEFHPVGDVNYETSKMQMLSGCLSSSVFIVLCLSLIDSSLSRIFLKQILPEDLQANQSWLL